MSAKRENINPAILYRNFSSLFDVTYDMDWMQLAIDVLWLFTSCVVYCNEGCKYVIGVLAIMLLA